MPESLTPIFDELMQEWKDGWRPTYGDPDEQEFEPETVEWEDE